MNCLLCKKLVKDTTFLHLLTVGERFFCYGCETKLMDGDQVVLKSLMTALNQGDVVLVQGIEALVKQYGVRNIKCQELMNELKEAVVHEEGVTLLKQVVKRNRKSRTIVVLK